MIFARLSSAVIIGSTWLSLIPAAAQYYDPYDRPPPRYGYDYDRPRYGYDRSYGRRQFGDQCVTSRGSCEAPPSPRNSPCRCFIEGFGPKRGAIY